MQYTIQYITVQNNAIYNTTQYNTKQYDTIQYLYFLHNMKKACKTYFTETLWYTK